MLSRREIPSEPLVLVVDDNESTYELLSEFLAMSGFAVAGASNGRDAVESALRLRPDLVVMDYDLPSRNGCEAARMIKTDPRTSQIPIILLTGYVEKRFVDLARQAGCDVF